MSITKRRSSAFRVNMNSSKMRCIANVELASRSGVDGSGTSNPPAPNRLAPGSGVDICNAAGYLVCPDTLGDHGGIESIARVGVKSLLASQRSSFVVHSGVSRKCYSVGVPVRRF